MELIFELGNNLQPKGHALAYFRSSSDANILATYLIVPPIRLDLTKYIPPMFAGKIPDVDAADLSSVAIPPIAEAIGSYQELQELAEMRDDDLIYAGTVDASRPDSILLAANEAARLYAEMYAKRPQAIKAAEEELRVQDVLYSLMGERDKLGEMAKLVGKLRYALDGEDTNLVEETIREMRLLGHLLPEKYKIDELIEVCKTPGEKGGRLATLYIDRCYRLSNEEDAELAKIEAEIKELQSTS